MKEVKEKIQIIKCKVNRQDVEKWIKDQETTQSNRESTNVEKWIYDAEKTHSPNLPPITKEMELEISSCLNSPLNENIVVTKLNTFPITLKSLMKLKGLNWLGWEVIEFYLEMLYVRSKENKNLPKLYVFMGGFYDHLVRPNKKGQHDNVKHRTNPRTRNTNIDIFGFDILLG